MEPYDILSFLENYLHNTISGHYDLEKTKPQPPIQEKLWKLPAKPVLRSIPPKPDKKKMETPSFEPPNTKGLKWRGSFCIVVGVFMSFVLMPALFRLVSNGDVAHSLFIGLVWLVCVFPILSYGRSLFRERWLMYDEAVQKWEEEKQQAIEEEQAIYNAALQSWSTTKNSIEELNRRRQDEYNRELLWREKENNRILQRNKESMLAYGEALKEWENRFKSHYYHMPNNLMIILQKALKKVPALIEPDCDLQYIPTYDIDYINNDMKTGTLVMDLFLPDFEEIKKLPKGYKKYSGEVIYYSETFLRKLYDNLIYQIIFASIYSIFTADTNKEIETIVINGKVKTIDRAIGKKCIVCITSLQISRHEFEELDFNLIDPKACFKHLKGLSGIHLDKKISVRPFMELNMYDKRFINPQDISEQINTATNLAAIDWQDFENLIRELFEKRFNRNGGQCKITQASRDGGVDAIAFDPDPIKGGKFIIQAKRYTNVVGVNAVRDLYGTLINEGANKGILITTSDYGVDAHKFAEGKPIVLLNGENLLYMLEEEMQIRAYIDIAEAKKIIKAQH